MDALASNKLRQLWNNKRNINLFLYIEVYIPFIVPELPQFIRSQGIHVLYIEVYIPFIVPELPCFY
jgi:hypothetical protein